MRDFSSIPKQRRRWCAIIRIDLWRKGFRAKGTHWILRLNGLQRKKPGGNVMCRVNASDTSSCDEFSIVVKHKTEKSYNPRGSESNQVKEYQNLLSRAS